MKDQAMQMECYIPEIGEALGQPMKINEEDLELGREIQIRTIKNLLIDKINALKLVSPNVHINYLVMQGVEYRCSKVISLLFQIFNKQGPSNPFYYRLVPMLAQKMDMPK